MAQCKLVLAAQHGRRRQRGGAPNPRLGALLDVRRQGVEWCERLVEAPLEQADVGDVGGMVQRRLADFAAEVDDLIRRRRGGQHLPKACPASVAQIGGRQGGDRLFDERLGEDGEIPRPEAVVDADFLETCHVAGPQVAAHEHTGSGVVPVAHHHVGARSAIDGWRFFLLALLQSCQRAQDRRERTVFARLTQQQQGGSSGNRHPVVPALGHAGAFERSDLGVQRGGVWRIERPKIGIFKQLPETLQGERPRREQGACLRQHAAAGRQRRQALGERRLVSAGHGEQRPFCGCAPALLPAGGVWQPSASVLVSVVCGKVERSRTCASGAIAPVYAAARVTDS